MQSVPKGCQSSPMVQLQCAHHVWATVSSPTNDACFLHTPHKERPPYVCARLIHQCDTGRMAFVGTCCATCTYHQCNEWWDRPMAQWSGSTINRQKLQRKQLHWCPPWFSIQLWQAGKFGWTISDYAVYIWRPEGLLVFWYHLSQLYELCNMSFTKWFVTACVMSFHFSEPLL